MAKNQTPLTLEAFQEILMPQIKLLIKKLDTKIKYLPTKKQYYKREDKTMYELKKLRDEVATSNYHYKKTNQRVDLIDEHLGIDTSSVFLNG